MIVLDVKKSFSKKLFLKQSGMFRTQFSKLPLKCNWLAGYGMQNGGTAAVCVSVVCNIRYSHFNTV